MWQHGKGPAAGRAADQTAGSRTRRPDLLFLQRAVGNRATADLVTAQRFGGGLDTAMLPPAQLAGAAVITRIVGAAEGAAMVGVQIVEGAVALAESPVVIGLAVVVGTGVLVYLALEDWRRYSTAVAPPGLAPRPRLPDEARIPRAVAAPAPALSPGNLVGPIAATLGAGLTLAQIRQHIVVRERTRGRDCVPPDPQPLAMWVQGRAFFDLPENLTRYWARRPGVPHSTMAVRQDRASFLRELRRAMNCAMVAAKCDGEIVGYAQGNKHIGDRRHAEEFALDQIRAQLRPRSRAELTGATLLSVCEQMPCNGQYAGKNCDRLLRRYWHGKSYGGAVSGMATGWPSGYDDAANTVYNTAWEALHQQSMSAAMRVPLQR